MQLNDLIQKNFKYMSKGKKLVATYVMHHPQEVATSSANEIGEKIGVSETTVIRFCHSLAFSGYGQFQKTTRQQLFAKESSLSAYQQSKLDLEKEPNFYEKVMEQDRQTILKTMKQVKEADYEQAINRLSEADTIYVIGLRTSYSAANWLALTLGLVKQNVRMLRPDMEDIVQAISQMNDKSVVIVISFHRYSKETIQIAKLVKEQGAYQIGITDSVVAPIHTTSNVLFPIHSPNKSTIDATAALFSFMNAIVAGLSVKEKDSFDKRQNLYNSVSSDFLFVEEEDSH